MVFRLSAALTRFLIKVTPARIVAATAVLVLGLAGTAYAVVNAVTEPSYTSMLVAAHSGQCLAAPGGGALFLRQAACKAGDQQRFEFTKSSGADTYELRNVATKACVEVSGARLDNGSPLVLASRCTRRANQRFALRATASDKTYMLVAAHSNRCADVYSAGQDSGAQVVQWDCGDPVRAGNQLFKIVTAPPSAPSPGQATVGTGEQPLAGPAPSPPASSAPAAPAPPASGSADPTGIGDASARIADNPVWGKQAPPASLPHSRAYDLILGDSPKGYQPRSGECSKADHAKYWVTGPDGVVYPTWHPAQGPGGCWFGHEHGADPTKSKLFAKTGLPAFGYINEHLAASDPASQRNEDHYGYKVDFADSIPVIKGDNIANPNRPASGDVQQTCSDLVVVHQGTHSPDAFASNLHQVSLNLECTYPDGGAIATRFNVLVPFGHPGSFNSTCTFREVTGAGTASPANSEDAPSGFSHTRSIPDTTCVDQVSGGKDLLGTMHELWNPRFNVSSGGLKFKADTLFYVLNPARYYDPAQPNKLGHVIDLCNTIPGIRDRSPGQGSFNMCKNVPTDTAWDSPTSPFNGCGRMFTSVFSLQNTGPTTWYTDVFGKRFSPTPFPGAVTQYFSGNHAAADGQAPIHNNFQYFCNTFGFGAANGVHAPN